MKIFKQLRHSSFIDISFITFTLMALCAPPALSAQFTLTPRVSLSEEYTDNVFLTDSDHRHDWISGVSLGFTAGMLAKTYGFTLAYDPKYVNYARSSYTNTWRHSANLAAWTDLSKTSRLDVKDRLLRTENPVPEYDVAEIRTQQPNLYIDPTIRRKPNPYLRNDASIHFTQRFRQRSNFEMGYSYAILRNSKDARDLGIEDNDRHTVDAGITHWFSVRWGGDAKISYDTVDYETSPDQSKYSGHVSLRRLFARDLEGYLRYSHTLVTYAGIDNEDTVYNPSAGVKYDIEKDISLSLDAGWYLADSKLREDQSGLTLDGRLTKKFRRGSLALSALSGYDYSFGSAEALGFQRYHEFGVSGSYQITRHIGCNAFGSYRFSKYVDQLPEREDNVYSAGAGISFQPLQWMTIALKYVYNSLNSNTVEGYVENRGMINITLSPTVPYRF